MFSTLTAGRGLRSRCRFRFVKVVAIVCGVNTVVGWAASVSATVQATVQNGVYTVEQSERGKQAYEQICTTCHGIDMQGTEMAVSLVGTGFLEYWETQTLGALYETIQLTMPDDDPGSLSPKVAVDLAAFVLRANGYPPGEHELEPNAELLEQIPMKKESRER